MKKILFLYLGRTGGGAKYSLEILRQMANANDVAVYAAVSKDNHLFSQISALNVNMVTIRTYSDILSMIGFCFKLPIYILKLGRLCKLNKINHVYSPMSHLFNGLIVFHLKKKGNITYTLTMHDSMTHPGELFERIKNILLSADIKLADKIITLTSEVKNKIKEYHDVRGKSFCVIPHGSFQYATPKVRALEPGSTIKLCFFGRILRYKGLELLFESMLILRSRIHSNKYFLSIYGSGDLKPYDDYIKKCVSAGVKYKIVNEWVNESDIGKIFDAQDVLIIPYIEASQSGVISIALACGLPVVATPVGGLSEQLSYGGGILAKSVSSESLANAIEQLTSNPDEYSFISEAALYASKYYDWDNISRKIINFATS